MRRRVAQLDGIAWEADRDAEILAGRGAKREAERCGGRTGLKLRQRFVSRREEAARLAAGGYSWQSMSAEPE